MYDIANVLPGAVCGLQGGGREFDIQEMSRRHTFKTVHNMCILIFTYKLVSVCVSTVALKFFGLRLITKSRALAEKICIYRVSQRVFQRFESKPERIMN